MGKGDKRTKKGKISRRSFGNSRRPLKKRNKTPAGKKAVVAKKDTRAAKK